MIKSLSLKSKSPPSAMANKILRTSVNENHFFKAVPNVIQKKCEHCEEEEKLQMKGESNASGGMAAPSVVHDVINSGGRPLDAGTRNFFEPKFGHDFSNVKIHNDPLAHQSSKDINALAYTHGQHIVFGNGQFQPNTNSGKQLLAHEMTHVLQQGSTVQRKGKPKIDRETFFRENCVGVEVDSSKAQCEFNDREKIVLRLAKEYAIRKCGQAILALDILNSQELDSLSKLVFHVDKSPPRSQIKTTIGNVRTKLETTPIFCKNCFDEICNKGGIMAYTPNDHTSIHICPLFFNKDKLTETPRFLIHEGCHAADVDINNFLSIMHSEGYCKTEDGKFNYWNNPCPEDNDNLTNADAWSFFIDRLSISV